MSTQANPEKIRTHTTHMRHFECDEDVKVLGISISAFLNNMKSEETRPYMERSGLYDIDPDKWYPGQSYADVINALAENTNQMENLVAVGIQIARQFELPPDEELTFEQFLVTWDDLYRLHFKGNVGSMTAEKLDDRHYRVINRTIWPDDLVYGVAYGFGRRLLPHGTNLKIQYETPTKRMDYGGHHETVMLVEWGS